MKKIKSIPVFFVAAVLCLLLINSCNDKENPVTQPDEPYQYDSARYDWKVDTLYGPGYFAGLWAPDTNEVFITNVFTNQLVHIKNDVKTFTQYPLLGSVLGDEMNNGYLVGAILIDNLWQPFLQKYDGNNFIDVHIPQNLDRNFFFHSLLIKNSNEMWFGLRGEVISFDGTKFRQFILEDSTMEIKKFFYDEENNLNFLSTVFHSDLFGGRTEFFLYQFTGNQWEKIYTDLKSPRPLRYDIINRSVSAANLHTIFELKDSALVPRINVPVYAFYFSLGGSSFNNIIISAAEIFPQDFYCVASLFNWNGNKWSIELCGYYVDGDTYILPINERFFYAVSFEIGSNRTFLMKGEKKIN